jgi:hypothetical protein
MDYRKHSVDCLCNRPRPCCVCGLRSPQGFDAAFAVETGGDRYGSTVHHYCSEGCQQGEKPNDY